MRGWDWTGRRAATVVVAVAACAFAALPAGAGAKVTFKRLSTANASSAAAVAMARTANGALHLVFQTFAGRTFSGLAAMSISKSGAPGPQLQALSWTTTQPGLVASPNGGLTAFFGSTNPSLMSTVWGMSSMNGGSTWGAPFDVKGTGPNEALAEDGDVTAIMSGGTPVLALPHAGNLVIQVGLGPTAANYQITVPANGSMTDADLAVDAATHEVVAGWRSGNGSGGDWLQGAAPAVGFAQSVPGQARNALIPSGRDNGAGVYAAYTPDGSHVRLLRYGGGSVAAGSIHGLAAKVLGTATGLGGRIWVFWGTDSPSGIAVTRSNRAVTRFEPIQRVDPKAFSLYRLSGDGRLGPLDLFANEIPIAKTVAPAGNYYARILPVLSASVKVTPVKNGKGHVIAELVTVKVTDAGDAVVGATVAIAGKKAKTNTSGVAKVTVPGASSGKAKQLTVTNAGYQPLALTVYL